VSNVAIITHIAIPNDGQGIVAHAIRATELVRALERKGHQARLVMVPKRAAYDTGSMRELLGSIAGADVVIASTALCAEVIRIRRSAKDVILVLDTFDASLVGAIPDTPEGVGGEIEFHSFRLLVEQAFHAADLFLCATEEQRLWLLGILSAWGRLTPQTYSSELILVVPTGVPGEPLPSQGTPLFRDRIVPRDASIVLWPGGVFNHYRPDVVLRALPAMIAACPNVRLVFVGAQNAAFAPNNDRLQRLHSTATAMNRGEARIFFEPGLPYSERYRMYADADVAVCFFDQSLETELSFRTRLVDILWGGNPVVTNTGGGLARLIDETESGIAVDNLEEPVVSRAIVRLLTDRELRARMARNARCVALERLTWDKVVEPLHQFCSAPRVSPDRDSLIHRLPLSAYGRADAFLRTRLLRLQRRLTTPGGSC
jgi:glycosyltransferase involved in cell wall biosynthesis